jgi:hypothetical protein
MEEGPGSIAPCGGGWHGGAGSRQVARPAEAVASRASAALAGEWDSVHGPRMRAWAERRREAAGPSPRATVSILI